jgi:hypothetical protein
MYLKASIKKNFEWFIFILCKQTFTQGTSRNPFEVNKKQGEIK